MCQSGCQSNFYILNYHWTTEVLEDTIQRTQRVLNRRQQQPSSQSASKPLIDERAFNDTTGRRASVVGTPNSGRVRLNEVLQQASELYPDEADTADPLQRLEGDDDLDDELFHSIDAPHVTPASPPQSKGE